MSSNDEKSINNSSTLNFSVDKKHVDEVDYNKNIFHNQQYHILSESDPHSSQSNLDRKTGNDESIQIISEGKKSNLSEKEKKNRNGILLNPNKNENPILHEVSNEINSSLSESVKLNDASSNKSPIKKEHNITSEQQNKKEMGNSPIDDNKSISTEDYPEVFFQGNEIQKRIHVITPFPKMEKDSRCCLLL